MGTDDILRDSFNFHDPSGMSALTWAWLGKGLIEVIQSSELTSFKNVDMIHQAILTTLVSTCDSTDRSLPKSIFFCWIYIYVSIPTCRSI